MRCEHDSVVPGPNGEESFINIKTLNEWDPRVCVAFFKYSFIYTTKVAGTIVKLKERSNISVKPKYKKKKKNMIQKL